MVASSRKVTFIVGPTGVGKSDHALSLASKNGMAIVNADSLQVYKGLDIGTSKPTLEERSQCPHYLFDIVKPGEAFTAGDYRRAVIDVLENIRVDAYIVGGSGFYIQALEKGMYEVGSVSESVKSEVEERISKYSHLGEKQSVVMALQEVDAAAAQRIPINDQYRLRRALEVSLSLGRPFSDLQREFESQHRPLSEFYSIEKIGLKMSRDKLLKRIQERTGHMLEKGLIEETRKFLDQGLEGWSPLRSVGYKETSAYLKGQIQREELFDAIVRATMRLAKKQMTWFRRDKDIQWHEV